MFKSETEEIRSMTSEHFATAVEALIKEAKANGLMEETLLIEIEDISSLLRESIDSEQRPGLEGMQGPWSCQAPVRPFHRS